MPKTIASRIMVRLAVICLLALFAANFAVAQPEQPDLTIDAATRTQVIDGILKRLNESYVFPEVAKKMEQSIRERVDKKEYDQITSAKQFATTLTKDLQAVSNDKHLRVRYSHEPVPERVPRLGAEALGERPSLSRVGICVIGRRREPRIVGLPHRDRFRVIEAGEGLPIDRPQQVVERGVQARRYQGIIPG